MKEYHRAHIQDRKQMQQFVTIMCVDMTDGVYCEVCVWCVEPKLTSSAHWSVSVRVSMVMADLPDYSQSVPKSPIQQN